MDYDAVVIAVWDKQAAIHKVRCELPREFERWANKKCVLVLL